MSIGPNKTLGLGLDALLAGGLDGSLAVGPDGSIDVGLDASLTKGLDATLSPEQSSKKSNQIWINTGEDMFLLLNLFIIIFII